ncbi:hypothetical protein J7I98_04245 [Streptomyces sp. ISL-98]|uniref:hypothetical protein n=1 Tax=Streptomyces sp. ISL-98 TaxID=2819192 RepID=UPI001BE75D88|nr:hypothetical protein [Streptomyces sp. ISL-98]MBT2505118.1 hypothetical protein [Streptomyces sp. ISL-98]
MTTTPMVGASAPAAGGCPRRIDAMAHLLAVIKRDRGEWTVGRAKPVYRHLLRKHIYRATIRRHLARLEAAGHLTRHGDGTPRRFYTYRKTGGNA